jgi:hypothetical protein
MPARTTINALLQELRSASALNFRNSSTLVVFLVAVFAASSLASGSWFVPTAKEASAFVLPLVFGATVLAAVLAFLAADVLIARIMAKSSRTA